MMLDSSRETVGQTKWEIIDTVSKKGDVDATTAAHANTDDSSSGYHGDWTHSSTSVHTCI